MLNVKTLELLGLKPKDWDIYLALLRLGTAPLRRIAEETTLNRGTTYDALKRLVANGLVTYVDAKTHRYFTCEDPVKLRGLATRRGVAIEEARETVIGLLPELQDLLGASEHRPSVRYYEGDAGVRDILADVLRTMERAESHEYQVYSSAAIRDLIAAAWPAFTKQRVKRKVSVRAISIGQGGETAGLDERKWLSRKESAPTYIFIYADKTAYVALDTSKQLFGVILEDAAIAATQLMIFNKLWDVL